MSKSTDNTFLLEDPVFGKMEYKHSWCRTHNIKWWQETDIDVQITAHAYSGEGISDQQREAFREYEKTIELIIKSSKKIIKEYISTYYDIALEDKELPEFLTPSNIIFLRDGSWGILFDAKFDIENGMALYREEGEFKVGSQDEFL